MRTTKVLDQRVDSFTLEEVFKLTKISIKKKQKNLFFAVNINILVQLHKDKFFKKIHSKFARIIFADGVLIIFLSYFSKNKIKNRVSGTDLTQKLINDENLKIFLLGSTESVLKKIKNKYSSIYGFYSPPFNNKWLKEEKGKIIKMINKSEANILLVATGPLKQERWLLDNFSQVNCNVGIGIGSALDIIAGEKMRAPRLLRDFGFEWLWRVLLEPKRLMGRYIKDFFYLLKMFIIMKK